MSRIAACRSCGAAALEVVLDLGLQPVANELIDPRRPGEPERRHPLEVGLCTECGLAQVMHTVPPAELFGRDYPYFSSFLPALVAYARDHARWLIEEQRLGRDSFVVEVASNDGYLLRNFVEAGIRALGIDPAPGPAAAARRTGVPTLQAFFGAETARAVAAEHGLADVIVANNVLAHVEGINDFVAGFAALLAPEGVAVFEFPYLRDLVESCAFDTIYHEHVFYHSLSALLPLLTRHGLHVVDAFRVPIHGGSLRLVVSRRPGASGRALRLLSQEERLGLRELAYWRGFAGRVEGVRTELRALLHRLKDEGARVAAYGAAAKGATLLNFVGVGHETIDYVVDRNPHKVGKLMPGARLPVRAVAALDDDPPDVLLLLAWNFGREIIAAQRGFAARGGRFLVPVPRPRLVAGTADLAAAEAATSVAPVA